VQYIPPTLRTPKTTSKMVLKMRFATFNLSCWRQHEIISCWRNICFLHCKILMVSKIHFKQKDIVLTFIVNYNPFVVCLFLSWPSLLGIQSKKKSKLVILAHQHKENVWNVFKINEYVLFISYSLKINKNIIKPSWNTHLLLIFWQIVFLDGITSIMLLPSSTQCTFLMSPPKKNHWPPIV